MAENTAKPRFKRRQFIVAREFQLKYAGVILLLMFLTAGFCAYFIYYTTLLLFGEKLASVYPQGQLVSIVKTVDFRVLIIMVIVSPLIGALGVYLSHKIAGPIFRIEKFLDAMASGNLASRITLRKGDEMVSLADAVNRVADFASQSITGEKAHVENLIKELYSLREMMAAAAPKERARIDAAIDRLDSELRVMSQGLDKYKLGEKV